MKPIVFILITVLVFLVASVVVYVNFSCKTAGKKCTDDSECCNGLSCPVGVGVCSPPCSTSGGSCKQDSDCCSGPCSADGKCCTTGACDKDSDCCDSQICDPVKKTCQQYCSTNACQTKADCCAGFNSCNNGKCSNVSWSDVWDGKGTTGNYIPRIFPDSSDPAACQNKCENDDKCIAYGYADDQSLKYCELFYDGDLTVSSIDGVIDRVKQMNDHHMVFKTSAITSPMLVSYTNSTSREIKTGDNNIISTEESPTHDSVDCALGCAKIPECKSFDLYHNMTCRYGRTPAFEDTKWDTYSGFVIQPAQKQVSKLRR
jgi:hypothetical protein